MKECKTLKLLLRTLTRCFIISFVLILSDTYNISAQQSNSNNHTSSRGIINNPERQFLIKSLQKTNKIGVNEFRTIDGSGNNLNDNEMGSAFIQLKRIKDYDYSDGISELSGKNRKSPREISNIVNDQGESIVNKFHTTDFLWQWGQFLDHDIDLTDAADPVEPAFIDVPPGDPFFDHNSAGQMIIPFNRSIYDDKSGTDKTNPRQQLNEITGWIDASNVYGSDLQRAAELRTHDGTGKLKTSKGDLLPFNINGFPNAGGPGANLFLAGDVRANEQVGLTAMHTLFVREHNRLAEDITKNNENLTGNEIFERAREIVAAQMQTITYYEFLPALIGHNAIGTYKNYNPDINASIMNSFSTAAYRFGHSALSATLLRLDSKGNEINAGNLDLREAFFSPSEIINEGIEPLLRGLARQKHQSIDVYIIDDVRNFLFGEPGHGGFDLASLNIQRGRDHGLPSYNDMREAVGLQRVDSFSEITTDKDIQRRLSESYVTVDDIDLWIGGLAEDTYRNSQLGRLFTKLIVLQFKSLRDGDRFWFERTLSEEEIREIKNTKLSDIIIRNTDIKKGEIQKNVFKIKNR